MHFKNTKEIYGLIAKIFHWPTAIIIMGLILVGLYMGTMVNGPDKFQVYMLHKSFGLLVLWLVGVRIIWRLINTQPEALSNHARWERILAKITHLMLYIAMIGMPLSGWLMSSAAGYPAPFFGIEMPDLISKNRDIAELMEEIHEVLANILIAAILLHALGAFKHHFIDKDSTLIRMMAGSARKIGPYILIAIVGAFALGIIALSLTEDDHHEKNEMHEVSQLEDSQSLAANGEWKIVKDLSSIEFKTKVYSKDFTGRFENFTGDIVFNPEDLAGSHANIIIDITSISSGDDERDITMLGSEWFDVNDYPTARFQAKEFQKKSDSNYVAIGELTIKNHSMPIILPFELDIVDDGGVQKAYMTGEVNLERLDYGLGEGRWEAADSVDLNVKVQTKLIALSK